MLLLLWCNQHNVIYKQKPWKTLPQRPCNINWQMHRAPLMVFPNMEVARSLLPNDNIQWKYFREVPELMISYKWFQPVNYKVNINFFGCSWEPEWYASKRHFSLVRLSHSHQLLWFGPSLSWYDSFIDSIGWETVLGSLAFFLLRPTLWPCKNKPWFFCIVGSFMKEIYLETLTLWVLKGLTYCWAKSWMSLLTDTPSLYLGISLNCHPISLLLCTAKLLEKVFYFFTLHSLLNPLQSGIWSYSSIKTALSKLTNSFLMDI